MKRRRYRRRYRYVWHGLYTSQLAQKTPAQPGRPSTDCVYRLTWQKWTCGNSNDSETCDCGIRQTMQHLLVCPMMNTACSTQDLTTANGFAIGCARHWEDTIWHQHATGGRTRMMMTALLQLNHTDTAFYGRACNYCHVWSHKVLPLKGLIMDQLLMNIQD